LPCLAAVQQHALGEEFPNLEDARIFQGSSTSRAPAHFTLRPPMFVGDGGSAGHGLIAFDDANVSALPITTGPKEWCAHLIHRLGKCGTRTTQPRLPGHPQDLQGCGRSDGGGRGPHPKWRKAYGHGLLTVDARHCNLLCNPAPQLLRQVHRSGSCLHDRLRKLQRDRQPWRCRNFDHVARSRTHAL